MNLDRENQMSCGRGTGRQSLWRLNPYHPVVGISWFEAYAYCDWLFQNWNNVSESEANSSLSPKSIRLSLKAEWIAAAGGDEEPEGVTLRDSTGQKTTSFKEFLRHENVNSDIGIGHTVAVNSYPLGKIPFGSDGYGGECMGMASELWKYV
ncbi:MAG: SUMF1/EgtB/PvdO family nonheme iron enzyme [Anaerolineales bacterium]